MGEGQEQGVQKCGMEGEQAVYGGGETVHCEERERLTLISDLQETE